MSGLYTRLVEWIMPFRNELAALSYYGGALFLLGAIFRWKWVCDPQEKMGWAALLSIGTSGEKGYRILQGISGAVIILCSVKRGY